MVTENHLKYFQLMRAQPFLMSIMLFLSRGVCCKVKCGCRSTPPAKQPFATMSSAPFAGWGPLQKGRPSPTSKLMMGRKVRRGTSNVQRAQREGIHVHNAGKGRNPCQRYGERQEWTADKSCRISRDFFFLFICIDRWHSSSLLVHAVISPNMVPALDFHVFFLIYSFFLWF